MLDIKISIIVPIYNCQNSLERCLKSISNQTYSNFEAILVDDGSKDDSVSVCQQWCKTDKRFLLLQKPNGGVSSARNLGLKSSSGDYICFVDADDFIEPNLCKEVAEQVNQNIEADVLIYGFNKIHKNKVKTILPKVKEKFDTSIDNFDELVEGHWSVVVWNKVIKKSIIKELFDQTIKNSEDLIFNAQFFKQKHTIYVINKVLYNYVNQTKTIGDRVDRFNVKEIVDMSKKLYDYLGVQYATLSNVNVLILKNIINTLMCNAKLKTKTLVQLLSNVEFEKEIKQLSNNAKTGNVLLRYLIYLIRHRHYKILVWLIKLKQKF